MYLVPCTLYRAPNDMKRGKRKWISIILSALLIALILRTFFFESYRMPSVQMENAVLQGDYLFVNKVSYGMRMPMTWISFPFVPDSIPALGIKTYVNYLSLPYKRIFEKKVKRNDVVIYNMPSLRENFPIDKSLLSISRCVGLPGDSVEMRNGEYFVNGKKLAQSPDLILPYKYPQHFDSQISYVMEKRHIPLRQTNVNADYATRYLSRFEAYSLREELPDSIEIILDERADLNYKLFIPKKGLTMKLSPEILHIYQQIISGEQENKVKVENGKLYIENSLADTYTFNLDYYWMLSDNTYSSADSRHFGFIPETHIVGKASVIWMSKEKKRIFTKVH